MGTRRGNLAFAASLALGALLASRAEADFSSCATNWSNFTGANGFVADYTYKGRSIRDFETSADPSNGGTGVSPTEIDLASGSSALNPGPYSTVAFGYYNGGTPWNANDPASMNDDSILFRWRLGATPVTGKKDLISRHFNVLFDTDADGYKDYWVDVNGSYQSSGSTDQLQVLFDNQNRQDVPDPNAARVAEFSASADPLAGTCGGVPGSPGRSFIRVVNAPDYASTGEVFLEVQVPLTAFKDQNGNQFLYPDSPVAFAYTTSASATDPLQKDFMMDLKFLSLADPIEFGDMVTPSGLPRIEFVNASSSPVSYYTVGGNVYVYLIDPLANVDKNSPECVRVTVTDPGTGDDEILTLCETGSSTGVFTNKGGTCDPSITSPAPAPVPPTVWLDGLSTSSSTVAESWSLAYDAAAGNWTVTGSVSGVQPRATQGIAYTSATGGISFTLYQSTPAAGTILAFCSQAADPLPISTAAGADDDGALQAAGGDSLYVSYTNRNSVTVTDTVGVVAPCQSMIQFTRATGLPTSDFRVTTDPNTSDKLYVTVTHAEANTNPATVQAIVVTLTGYDTQTLTLTETGPNTGVFRNTTGLSTQIAAPPVAANDGLWEDADGGLVTATYAYTCGGTSYSQSTSGSLFATAAGGRVEFTNGAGTLDVDLYTSGQAVFVKVTDSTGCAGAITATVTSSSGDSETLTLTQTAPGSGVYMNRTNDLATTAGSALVTSASSNFTAMGLAPGSRFAIATGPDAGLYTIASVNGATQVTLTQALTTTRTGIAFNAKPLMTGVYAAPTASNDGVLEAAHGDTVTVSYNDCNDGDTDPTNNVKTDSAAFNAPPLLLNRVLFAPASGGSSCQTELVEILNTSTAPVVATGYRVQDEDAELSYTIPDFNGAPLTLQPGEKIVLSIGGSFGDFLSAGTYYLFTPSASYPSNVLGGPGDPDPADQVQLYDALQRVVDYVGWSGTLSNSIDFYSDDSPAVLERLWQNDAFRNVSGTTAGQVLRRSTDGFDTNQPSDWVLGADNTCQTIVDTYAVTRATIQGIRVDPVGLVEFATGTQQGTVGFDLYQTDRRKGGALVKLNREPVLALFRDSLTPIVYRVETEPITLPYLVIEELDESGQRRAMGPFAVDDARSAKALDRIQIRLDEAGAPRGTAMRIVPGRAWKRLAGGSSPRPASPPRAPNATSSGQGVKLLVSGSGVAQVRLADLTPWGLDLRGAGIGGLRLWNQGRRVAYREIPGADPRIAFQAEALSTDMTGQNVYVLTWGEPAKPMAVGLTRSGDPVEPGFTRVEHSTIYLAHAPESADPWLWDVLFTGGGTWPYSWWDPTAGSFDLPQLAPSTSGTVAVSLRLLGGTKHTHRVQAWINGGYVGGITFEGAAPAVLTGALPASDLKPAGNQLVVEYAADTADAGDWGLAYIDSLDLAIPQAPQTRAATVDAIAAYDSGIDLANRPDYLIVSHADFLAASRRIAAAKEAEGHRTVVVDVERAYDLFSGGIPEAQAVRALIRRFAAGGRLHNVLLVGDDTFDPRDYSGMGARSYIPSLLAWDPNFGRVPSENAYADVDGDGRPDVAIGRLPVQSAEQARTLADKIVGQTAALAQVPRRQLVAVDNQGPTDPPFRANAEAALGSFAQAGQISWADIGNGVDEARAKLFTGLSKGALVTHYFGHGGPELWADEALLSMTDVPALAGAKATVLFTWACQAQWYLNLWGPSINEALVLMPGGPVASVGPAGITTPAQQRALYDGVYRGFMREGLSLGEAVRRAKREALDADASVRPAVEGYNLIGDPSLTLPASR